jgi:hypothetical protein
MKKNPGYKNKQRLKLNLFSLRLFFEEKNTPTYYRPCLKLLVSGQMRQKQCFGSGSGFYTDAIWFLDPNPD